MARQIASGVAGMSIWRTPCGDSASTIAFITEGSEPAQPASPQPLAPTGLVRVGTPSLMKVKKGTSAARGAEESLMLTGDENIIDINFSVQWRADAAAPEKYAFRLENPKETVKALAESAMREIVGKSKMDYVLYEGREDIAVRFKYWVNDKGQIVQDQDDDNLRREEVVTEDFAWAGRMYEDMFG